MLRCWLTLLKVLQKALNKLPKIFLVYFQPNLSFNFYIPHLIFFKELTIFTRSYFFSNVYCSEGARYFYHFYSSLRSQLIFVTTEFWVFSLPANCVPCIFTYVLYLKNVAKSIISRTRSFIYIISTKRAGGGVGHQIRNNWFADGFRWLLGKDVFFWHCRRPHVQKPNLLFSIECKIFGHFLVFIYYTLLPFLKFFCS